MDEKKKGIVSVVGDSIYRIEISYTKKHSVKDCAMCKIMHNHDSAPVDGIQQLATAVPEILEYFSHDIVNSEVYSHCERIGITVMRQHGAFWHCDAQYEIQRGE